MISTGLFFLGFALLLFEPIWLPHPLLGSSCVVQGARVHRVWRSTFVCLIVLPSNFIWGFPITRPREIARFWLD